MSDCRKAYNCLNEADASDDGRRTLRYTRDEGRRLTKNDRLFYEANGYLVVPGLLPLDILRRCDERFEEIASGKVPRGAMTVMRDVTDRSLINKIQDLNTDEVFSEYFEYKPLLDIVESFTGPNIIAVHSMLIAKPPDAGSTSSRHPPHQDMYYFPFRPADRIVAAWTAIEPCDTLNGCLYVSPGSHASGRLFPHGYPRASTAGPVNKLYHEIQSLPDTMTWINLETQPGDTLFFHPLLVHGSGVNRTKGTRKAISCHYAAADCDYTKVLDTVQDPVRDEVMEVVNKRYPGLKIDYADVWRMKSKLVRGMRSSL